MVRRAFTPADLLRVSAVADPRFSPDGRRVAWVESSIAEEGDAVHTRIYVADIGGPPGGRLFTRGPAHHSPRWSPDGHFLSYVSDGADGSTLLVAPLAGGEPRAVATGAGPLTCPCWSSEGRRLAYVRPVSAEKPTSGPRVVTAPLSRLDGRGWREGWAQLFTVDLAEGREVQLTQGNYDVDAPAWSPDGQTLVFSSDREPEATERIMHADVWQIPAAGGEPRRITRARGFAAHPVFSPDGAWIAFVGGEDGNKNWDKDAKVHVVSSRGEGLRRLGAGFDRGVAVGLGALTAPSWLTDSSGVLFLAADEGRIGIYEVRLDDDTVRPILSGERRLEQFQLAPDGDSIVFTAHWPSAPIEVHAARRQDPSAERQVSNANQAVRDTVEWPRITRSRVAAADGLPIEAFLATPTNAEERPLPLVVDLHGGPHLLHPHPPSFLLAATLTGAGYAVLMPNPRGSASYGSGFTAGITGGWGGADFTDVMACVSQLVDTGVADGHRLFLHGYSYGGFLATWMLGHSDRFRAAAVGAPVTDPRSMLGTTDIPDFIAYEMGVSLRDDAAHAHRSPVDAISSASPPTLVYHWEDDLRCPINQAELLFAKLHAVGVETTLLRYPGGAHGHATHTPGQIQDSFERILSWFSMHDLFEPVLATTGETHAGPHS